ncbi:hypothetical protein TRIUR3_02463 [Triticum urartu]|uniref:Uncharacterized protein n=1 Tax=Triticum urartu TaxID=4572 RepID=M7Z300_TRIUA|nr:hypothetical protein TRIUR3_02463 [Triticum urartu]
MGAWAVCVGVGLLATARRFSRRRAALRDFVSWELSIKASSVYVHTYTRNQQSQHATVHQKLMIKPTKTSVQAFPARVPSCTCTVSILSAAAMAKLTPAISLVGEVSLRAIKVEPEDAYVNKAARIRAGPHARTISKSSSMQDYGPRDTKDELM